MVWFIVWLRLIKCMICSMRTILDEKPNVIVPNIEQQYLLTDPTHRKLLAERNKLICLNDWYAQEHVLKKH